MMQPLDNLPLAARRRIRGVFTDIDDTLTTDGKLTAAAYEALERLHAAGLLVVPITGRPAGWCDHIARMWPVDAVVGENGAFYFRHDEATRKLVKRYLLPEAERVANRARLGSLRDRLPRGRAGAAARRRRSHRRDFHRRRRDRENQFDPCQRLVRRL
jgi:hypothetical protein